MKTDGIHNESPTSQKIRLRKTFRSSTKYSPAIFFLTAKNQKQLRPNPQSNTKDPFRQSLLMTQMPVA